MAAHGQPGATSVRARRPRPRVLSAAAGRIGRSAHIYRLILVAVFCACALAPLAFVGQTMSTVAAAWLATAGAVGSNVLADLITKTVGRRGLPGAVRECTRQLNAATRAQQAESHAQSQHRRQVQRALAQILLLLESSSSPPGDQHVRAATDDVCAPGSRNLAGRTQRMPQG